MRIAYYTHMVHTVYSICKYANSQIVYLNIMEYLQTEQLDNCISLIALMDECHKCHNES